MISIVRKVLWYACVTMCGINAVIAVLLNNSFIAGLPWVVAILTWIVVFIVNKELELQQSINNVMMSRIDESKRRKVGVKR